MNTRTRGDANALADSVSLVVASDPRPSAPPSPPYTLSPLSLTFRDGTGYDDWAYYTGRLIEIHRGIDWWLADAFLYGEGTFGEIYAQVVPEGTYSRGAIRNAMSTARSIPPSRRRPTLSLHMHTEIQALPDDLGDRMLDLAEENEWTREELRAQVRTAKRTAERIAAESRPVPEDLPTLITIEVGDATDMPLDIGTVDLIITSPPYGLGKDYGGSDDDHANYVTLLTRFATDSFAVAKFGGRLALNVPLDTTLGGTRPTYAQAVNLMRAGGWDYRFSIVWREDTVNKSVARGSVDSPQAPHVMAPVEMIAVFCKGEWKRDPREQTWDLTHEEWLEWTNGLWTFGGETNPWEGFEAAFPIELPRRLIKLLSFKDDVVCDPFGGSFTTAAAAYILGRKFFGYDINGKQVASGRRRIAAMAGAVGGK